MADLRIDACTAVLGDISQRLDSYERSRRDVETRADPPVSEKQRHASRAAASGNSTLDIPKDVGEEFSEADPGGKLPESKKDANGFPPSVVHKGKTYWSTGKIGTHKSGDRSAEYGYNEDPRDTGRSIDQRVWMRLPSGVVEEE
jgi:hypothetical protein